MDIAVTMRAEELAAMIEEVVARRLKPIEDKILHVPDTTQVSDEEAANMKGVSVSTIRRMKKDGRLTSIDTPRGRVCRICDL
jgi:hypothetical protein